MFEKLSNVVHNTRVRMQAGPARVQNPSIYIYIYIYIYGHTPPPMIHTNLLFNYYCVVLRPKMLSRRVRIYRYLQCFPHFMYMYT